MPTINNATVATGTGLTTEGNGGRKLVRLLNGALVSAVRTSNTSWQLHKSLDGGTTWSQLVSVTEAVNDVTLAAKGNDIHFVAASTTAVKHYRYNDSGVLQGVAQTIDSGQTGIEGVSTVINNAGNEIHATWHSTSSGYNRNNIRYVKGTIAADGSVTFVSAIMLTTENSTLSNMMYPVVTMNAQDNPVIVFYQSNSSGNTVLSKMKIGTTWQSNVTVFSAGSYSQGTLSVIFIPQSISGLSSGRIWLAWHGVDATDQAAANIRTSYSDNGGSTWSTPVKQTTGNTSDQRIASLTADKNNKVYLLWGSANQTLLKVFSGTWSTSTALPGDGYTSVSTLFDSSFNLNMVIPPLVRRSSSGVYYSGDYSTVSIAPASGALGDKTASSVLSYTVTPESGSTVTSIVEKVNGTTVNTYSNPASLSRTFTIPLANWDALKYYNTHTISVTVTDSNGMANTQTYTFNKALANDASLLEGAKAAKDGKDRIGTKRDGIAGQVGLPPGSTFDAISTAISSNLRKTAAGTVNSSSAEVSFVDSNGTVRSFNAVTVSGIGFTPSAIMVYQSSNGVPACSVNTNALADSNGFKLILRNVNGGSIGYAIRLAGNAYITNGTFQMPVSSGLGNTPHYWFAIE